MLPSLFTPLKRQTLNCSNCENIDIIPMLPSLTRLQCSCCYITVLPEMPSLQFLDCHWCPWLAALPKYSSLRGLWPPQQLDCFQCPFLYIHPINRKHVQKYQRVKSKLIGLRIVCLQRRIKQKIAQQKCRLFLEELFQKKPELTKLFRGLRRTDAFADAQECRGETRDDSVSDFT